MPNTSLMCNHDVVLNYCKIKLLSSRALSMFEGKRQFFVLEVGVHVICVYNVHKVSFLWVDGHSCAFAQK